MPKTIRNIFYTKLTLEKLLSAHYRAKRNKTSKKEIILFEIDLETNITNLYNNLRKKRYKVGKYKIIVIHEPKERIIKSLPYPDRVIHQWYIEEFIKPFIVPRFIKDTYACIIDRGTHRAVQVLQGYMRVMKRTYGNYYIIKCDIKKFFYNIDKNILYSLMEKYIKDKDLLYLTHAMIFDEENVPVGIPIGNFTSQYFANIYLNELDYYVKEELKIKYYVRYMDDFVLLVTDKEEAKAILLLIREYVNKFLKLELNQKSRYYPNSMGVNFCGYRIFETHRLLRTNSKQKIKNKIRKWHKLKIKGRLDREKMRLQWNSWVAHANHANTYNLQERMLDKKNKL